MRRGFTIVELLIVIVVVAILAVIAIASYNGIQSRAHDAAIRSDFNNISKLLEVYKIQEGKYPSDPAGNTGGSCSTQSSVILAALRSIQMKLSTSSYNTGGANTNLLYVASNDGEKYALLGYALGNPTYYITNEKQVPAVYVDNGTSQSEYPGGTPCGVADHLGVSAPTTNEDFGFYYIYRRSGGGFQMWE